MDNKIIIPLPLITMNEYTNLNRSHWSKGSKAKKQTDYICYMHIKKAMNVGVKFTFPSILEFNWFCKDKRSDPDNIASATKFILDAMQSANFLKNDNWGNIQGFNHRFYVDKKNPRVEIKQFWEE